MPNEPFTVTVSQLNRKISFMLSAERTFADLCVKGEISNLSINARSGHIFFTLKDENSAVRAVMFRSYADNLKFLPENGMSVVVRGSVKCFERDGVYQIYVSDIMNGGEGALSAAFEQLKAKLEAEGLFARKRPLPKMPKKICVITSETGAVLQDIKNVLGRRCPQVKVLLIPAVVQGENAPDSIVSALKKANKTDAELIIFGRGGGSAEDLSCFNSEEVAREIFASRIPTISAVGHETDFTIADFVADMRAPTPSAAAELAVPDMREMLSQLTDMKRMLGRTLNRLIDNKLVAVKLIDGNIKLSSPQRRLVLNEQKIDAVSDRIKSQIKVLVDSREHSLMRTAAVVEALNPLAVLMRGYSITTLDGKAVVSVDEIKENDRIKIRVSDGVINAVAESKEKGIV